MSCLCRVYAEKERESRDIRFMPRFNGSRCLREESLKCIPRPTRCKVENIMMRVYMKYV